MTIEEQMKKLLKRSIRDNYNIYMKNFRNRYTLNDVINEPYKALELAFIKECHYFLMRDIDFNYNLFKAVYDKAFIDGFNEFNDDNNLYSYLVIHFKKKDTFDFQCWSCLTEFFKDIVTEGDDK